MLARERLSNSDSALLWQLAPICRGLAPLALAHVDACDPCVRCQVRLHLPASRQVLARFDDTAIGSFTPCHGVFVPRNLRVVSSGMKTDGSKLLTAEELQGRVGRAVSSVRKAKAMTQEEVANRAGIGWRHIQKIEAGEINTTLRTISRLAAALGVDPSRLIKDIDGA